MNDRPFQTHRNFTGPIFTGPIFRGLIVAGYAWLSMPALADDVEIFISTGDQEIACEAPNILFIIDTSSSMDADVVTQEPWNPEVEYDGCFNPTRIYYSESGVTPECDHQFTFAKADLFCQATASGTEYTGLFQAWNPAVNTWVKIPDTDDDFFIECAADEGIHGNGNNDKNFAIDGKGGPWSDKEDKRVAWGANATSATLFDGNWLNWQQNPPVLVRSRLAVVQEAVNNTLNNLGDVNVGVMEFNPTEGGPVIAAMDNLDDSRVALQATIDGLEPGGSTPLSETLYEAGQYLAGRLVDFGDNDINNRSVAAARVGGNIDNNRYASPLLGGGQNNYIVLLTDGMPADDTSANRKIEALPGYGVSVGEPCNDNIEGDCLDKMAKYLNVTDLRNDLDGQQSIITHTIGFATDFDLLKSTAELGGGKYFVVDNTTTLTRALANLAKDFSRQASLLSAPTVPLNVFNRSGQLNEVYLSLFQPAATTHWPGNLKKYRLKPTANGPVLVDANGRSVLTENNTIDSAAVSLWSEPLVDGGDARLGGAASLLTTPATRNLLTNAAGGTGLSSLNVGNPAITAALLGAPEDERDTVIRWARGYDVRDVNGNGDTNEPRLSMGDPLHVQPVVGEYGENEGNRNSVVFVATNDGYLHAVDAFTGKEIWSFIPQRLLKRLFALSTEEAAQNKQYGLDGELVLVTNENGRPESLLFGMRRGGEALFSMNITNRNTPKLNWIIDSSKARFVDMGQTWSPPVISVMNIGGQTRKVAIFGGGYDPGQDNRVHRTDTKGNAIYIVDVASGNLLWSAGSAQTARGPHDLLLERMNYSIPAGIRVLDQNEDGLADRMYVGDMGGQVWRFDIQNGSSAGGVLASLGAADLDNPARADVRRFYNTPDVVNVIKAENVFFAINIGSGYRAHPLDTSIDDEFYSIRDFNSTRVIPTDKYDTVDFPLIEREDLIDITNNAAPVLEPSDAGWRLGMVQNNGEKILGESVTVDNVVFFNSFAPTGAAQSCLPGAGINRFYRISILDGSPLTNLDDSVDDDILTPLDRFVEGDIGAPTSSPGLVFRSDGKIEVCSGVNCFSEDNQTFTTEPVNKTYWYPVATP